MQPAIKTPTPGQGQAQINSTNDHSTHPYLERKQIDLADLRQACLSARIEIRNDRVSRYDKDGNRIEPWSGMMIFRELVDAAGASAGFERILPEKVQKAENAKPNDKFTTPGSKVSGTFTPIGFRPDDLLSLSGPLVVCAGLADGYSIHLATGYPVACCVGEMMVGSVVKVLRTAAGHAELLAAVDNDDAGHRAADAAGIKWSCPSTLKDWSDVRQEEGLQAVREQLLVSQEPEVKPNDSQAMKPKPLPDSLPPVDKLGPETLPDELRDYVFDVASRLQCPPDYCAVVAIGCLAGLLGRKVLMKPKQLDDWVVVANQWVAMIGGPSAMKSPALKAMRFPLDAIEAEMRRLHQEGQAQHEVDTELLELEKSAAKAEAKRLAKKGDKEGARAALQAVQDAKEPGSPPRIVVNDATVEKLGELMNENPSLILVRDEQSGWLAKMQSGEHASDRAFYLEAFNGDGRFVYDRIGRGTVVIDHCILSIVGGIQPSKIAPIVRAAAKGIADDGLIQRFQLAVWPDPVADWKWIDRAPDPKAKERYSQVFYRLHALELPSHDDEPASWGFAPDAQPLFVEWMEEIQRDARAGNLSPVLEEHLLKLPKTVCGLALLFAVIDGDQGQVGRVATARALAWADYLRTHAERLYSAVSNAAIEGARIIHARRDKLSHPFTARQVQQKGWSGLDSGEAVREALEVLVDHDHLTAITTRPETGRPRTDYWWHSSLAPESVS